MIKVELEGKTKEIELHPISKGKSLTLKDLILELAINLEDYILVLNGEVVTEFESPKDGDSLKLVRVWSGG